MGRLTVVRLNMMPVKDDQKATLHVALAGRFHKHERLLDALDPVRRRKATTRSSRQPSRWQSTQDFPKGPRKRTSSSSLATSGPVLRAARIDPRVAERVMLAMTSDREIDDIDPRAGYQARLVLLFALIADARSDEATLGKFMGQARRLADKWLS